MKTYLKIALVLCVVEIIQFSLPVIWNELLHDFTILTGKSIIAGYLLSYENMLGLTQFLLVAVVVNRIWIKAEVKYFSHLDNISSRICWISILYAISVLLVIALSGISFWQQMLGLIITEYVFIAFVEETIFRGVITSVLIGYGKREKVLVSSIVFALMHLIAYIYSAGQISIVGMFTASLMPLILGFITEYAYISSGVLLPSILIHGTYNVMVVFSLGIISMPIIISYLVIMVYLLGQSCINEKKVFQ